MFKRFYIAVLWILLSTGTRAQTRTFLDMGDSVKTWVNERVENAKKGIKEKVQMPFVVRSSGWGCLCPDYYIGVSVGTNEGPWIMPVKPKKFPVVDATGHSLIVTGYFTGKTIEQDFRKTEGEPDEWLYKMPEFKILSWKVNEKDYNVEAPKIISTHKK